jgi:penicillin-binding protein 1A
MTKKQTKQSKRKKFFFILKFLGMSFLFLIFVFLALFAYYTKNLPRPEIFAEKSIVLPTRIYDRTGEILLYQVYGDETRIMISLNEVPNYLIYAILAAEDNRFYEHFGLDFKGIARAVWINFKTGKIAQGGSTLTQQLARTAFLIREESLERKIQEVVLTLELEKRYSKDQILEWYLNHIPLGLAEGVGAASQIFFNKPVSNLSLAESVVLASLIRAPSRLSPFGPNKDELFIIKDAVLDEMAEENFISKEKAEEVKKQEIIFADNRKQYLKAPHFTLYIKEYLVNKYGEDFLKKRGLKIITSLDWKMQQLAEKVIKEGVEINRKNNAHNAALVAINPNTGEILTMVGSANWFGEPHPNPCQPGIDCLFDPKFNVAISNPGRQPGSAFKPFVYAAAFEKGYNDKTILIDKETNFGIWGGKPFIPQNHDRKFRGEVSIRNSLAESLNIPSVKILLDLAGLENSVKTAQNMGITGLKPPFFLSIVLGGEEVKLLDITSAYGVFATQGYKVSPVGILRIKDIQGNIIEENKRTPKRVLSKKTSRLINDILSDKEARRPTFGTSLDLRSNNLDYDVAVKTGTAGEFKHNIWLRRDMWTIGYTFNKTFNNIPLVVGVWVGNSDNSPVKHGPVFAIPIWRTFMERILF